MALLNRRGWTTLRCAAISFQFGKLFNRTAAASSSGTGCTSKLFVGVQVFLTILMKQLSRTLSLNMVLLLQVVCHPTTGKSKGFGFVTFSSQDEAAKAAHKMDGEVLDGRNIRVHYSNTG
ncbi:small RNA-binding protein 11, chloroplastic-like isoform X2 [Panicum virgatum]|uniref:small RNA-binding protein 11, chloroplastic-like isoform X2 n=1 Tax=Panicum virgatum TaxID=38727 RepID=UPI0019D62EF8|nr:small RNA-binding protein 11, chloroplastic-like isoform X2 [Panicum virgatum]